MFQTVGAFRLRYRRRAHPEERRRFLLDETDVRAHVEEIISDLIRLGVPEVTMLETALLGRDENTEATFAPSRQPAMFDYLPPKSARYPAVVPKRR